MHKYICIKCDNLLCETSICPVCNERTELHSTEVYYCKKCNTPLFDNTCSVCGSSCEKVGSDLRSVFAEERLLLEVLIGKPHNKQYTKEFKMQVVKEYLDGKGSLLDLKKKYKILSRETIRKWVLVYNSGKEIKHYLPNHEVYTMKTRKVT